MKPTVLTCNTPFSGRDGRDNRRVNARIGMRGVPPRFHRHRGAAGIFGAGLDVAVQEALPLLWIDKNR